MVSTKYSILLSKLSCLQTGPCSMEAPENRDADENSTAECLLGIGNIENRQDQGMEGNKVSVPKCISPHSFESCVTICAMRRVQNTEELTSFLLILMNIRKSESDLYYFTMLDKTFWSGLFFAVLCGDNYSRKMMMGNFA